LGHPKNPTETSDHLGLISPKFAAVTIRMQDTVPGKRYEGEKPGKHPVRIYILWLWDGFS